MKNGFSHHYHLGESTVIIRDIRGDFEFLFLFSMKFLNPNRIWGYSVCLCPIKGTPGLNELNTHTKNAMLSLAVTE